MEEGIQEGVGHLVAYLITFIAAQGQGRKDRQDSVVTQCDPLRLFRPRFNDFALSFASLIICMEIYVRLLCFK